MVKSMLYGRLGNQLFQKAASIGYAARYGIEYDLSGRHLQGIRINEDGHHYQELPFYANSNIILNGYWQSQKYFSHCREEVIKAFGYSKLPLQDACSIHVRRGDYLNYPDKHPVITDAYLKEAVNYMIGMGNYRFIFFSDDIEWCREYVKIGYFDDRWLTYEFSEGKTEKDDLELMSSCQDHIISNSTFGWWGAWLGQNPEKTVVSPSKDNWFGPGNAHLDTSDLIPDSWIQIKY